MSECSRSAYTARSLSSTKKLLLVQPSLQPPGGGNAVAAWTIEALRDEHALTVLTWQTIDLDEINRFCGTSIREDDFEWRRVPAAWRMPFDLSPFPLSHLKRSLLLRAAKGIAADYDVCLTVHNEADFGRRGIQYVHFPWAYHPRPPVDLRWYHGSEAIVLGYYRLCSRIADFSFERMKQNLTLVNSNWTGTRVKELHGIETTTVYPPVPGSFPEISWAERKSGFLCIGRLSPEKELDKVIDVIAAIRAHGHDVHLHLVGTAEDEAYAARIRRRARSEPAWLFVEENLPRDRLANLVAHHRYGIHGKAEEHFGMAIAEMTSAGCIVFVPEGGGQTEIADDSRLFYGSVEEATEKIDRVLRDPGLQASLRTHLESRRQRFSTERFVADIRGLVERF